MQFRNFLKTILLVISISSVASAYLIPGPPGSGGGGGVRPPPYPGGGGPGPNPYPGGPGPRPPMPPPNYPPQPPPYYPPPRPPQPPPYYPPPRPPQPPPYYPPPPPPPPYYPPAPPPPYYPPNPPSYGNEVRRIYLNRNIINENISLRDLAGIGYGYSGWEVVSVRANVRPINMGGRTVAQLLLDGRVVATQVDPSYQISLYPQSRLILDQSGRQLTLAIGGGVYIDQVEIEVRRDGGGYNPNPNPQPPYGQSIEINLYRSVMGSDRIDLTQYTDLQRYYGSRIEQVVVTGSTRYGSAAMSVTINGNNMGQLQFSGGSSQRQSVWLSQLPVIGQGADSIVLYTSGDMTIEHVTLILR